MENKIINNLNKLEEYLIEESNIEIIDLQKVQTFLSKIRNEALAINGVSRSKPKEEKQILDSEKKCKGNTIKDYYIIDEETLRNLTQSTEDKTLS